MAYLQLNYHVSETRYGEIKTHRKRRMALALLEYHKENGIGGLMMKRIIKKLYYEAIVR